MVVALLVTFLPFRHTEIYAGISENAYSYYQEYGNNVCFFPVLGNRWDDLLCHQSKSGKFEYPLPDNRMEVVGKAILPGKTADDVFLNLAETICMRCIVSEKVVQNIICMR